MTQINAGRRNRHLPQARPAAHSVRMSPPDALPVPFDRCRVALTVNGGAVDVDLPACATLAELLRDRLGLTGTKVACNQAACGACTVQLDGAAVFACHTLALHARGSDVRTIEGMARGGVLTPLQQALIQRDAMQCGFCTPGMIMSCVALLEKNKQPTLDDVKQATCGNLCRCGTYPKVFDATLAAAKQMTGNNA